VEQSKVCLWLSWQILPAEQSFIKKLAYLIWFSKGVLSSLLILTPAISALTFADSEHLSPTRGAHTLCGWPTILHGYALGILHFLFGAAFHTVRLHLFTSLFEYEG